MIKNGNQKKLSEFSPTPDLSFGFSRLMRPAKIAVVYQAQSLGWVSNNVSYTDVLMRKTPLKPQQIAIKPEGERAWRWVEIFMMADQIFSVKDVLIVDEMQYRIMAVENWREYGYCRYEAVEDFIGAVTN